MAVYRYVIGTAILFCAFYTIQIPFVAAADVYIETNKGCGSDALFSLSEDFTISFRVTGAQPSSEYQYWINDYTGAGDILASWGGVLTTNSAGESLLEYKTSIASLPVGRHYIQINIPDLELVKTCEYYVEGETAIPVWEDGLSPSTPQTTCYCEDLALAAELDKTTAVLGDTVTITITVVNNMDCGYLIGARSLLVDLGVLGGLVYPLDVDRKVDEKTDQPIAAYTFTVPDVPEGNYSVNMVYIEPYCTWATAVFLRVGAAGSISVVSELQPLRIDEEGSVTVEVTNPTAEDTTYTVSVRTPEGLTLQNPVYTVRVASQSSERVTVVVSAAAEGEYTLYFELILEEVIDETSATVTVEEPPAASLDIVSPISTIEPEQTVQLQMQVTNSSRKDRTYTVTAYASEGLTLSETVWDISVARETSKTFFVSVTAAESGPGHVDFELAYENELLDSATWNVDVEEGNTVIVVAAAVGVSAAAGAAVFKLKPDILKPTTEKTIETYEKAFELAKKGGELEEAAEICEKAADAWKKIDNVKKAVDFYKEAAKIWRKLKELTKALEDEEKAAEVYEDAGLQAEVAGELQKAVKYYEKAAEGYGKIGDLAQEIKELNVAGTYYEKAANLWRKVGKAETAGDFYRKAARVITQLDASRAKEREEKAAEAYEDAGLQAEVVDTLLEAADCFEKAADLWKKTGYTSRTKAAEEKTAEIYEKAGDKSIQAGEFQKAGIYYEKAADLWKKTKNTSRTKAAEEKAIKAYEKAVP